MCFNGVHSTKHPSSVMLLTLGAAVTKRGNINMICITIDNSMYFKQYFLWGFSPGADLSARDEFELEFSGSSEPEL